MICKGTDLVVQDKLTDMTLSENDKNALLQGLTVARHVIGSTIAKWKH
jgi:hypothetical protein